MDRFEKEVVVYSKRTCDKCGIAIDRGIYYRGYLYCNDCLKEKIMEQFSHDLEIMLDDYAINNELSKKNDLYDITEKYIEESIEESSEEQEPFELWQ